LVIIFLHPDFFWSMTVAQFQLTRRLWLLLAALVGLVGVRLGMGFSPNKPVPESQAQRRGVESGIEYGWLTDYEEGRKLARATGKPMMVVIRCFP
jgi:hypothetical protein